MKNLFVIHDTGEFMKIADIEKVSDDIVVDPTLYYECEDVEFFEKVEELLKENFIRYPKGLERPLRESDLILDHMGSMSVARSECEGTARIALQSRIDLTSILDLYEFIILNNELTDKGYIITDGNREEKYLEILSDGKNELLDILERYLDVRERLSQSTHWYKIFRELTEDFDTYSTPKELHERLNIFLNLFQ